MRVAIKLIIAFFFALLVVFLWNRYLSPAKYLNEKGSVVEGKVVVNNEVVEGVVVTDGTNFAVTDKNGVYSLSCNSSATHIYISSPAGYTVPVENSVPKFWIKLTKESDRKNINFTLNKMSVSDQKHYFIAIGDPQVRNEKEIVKLNSILDFLKSDIRDNNLNPVHLMVVGDMVFDAPEMHNLSKSSFKTVDQPVYYCIGNHDHLQRKNILASDEYDKVASKDYVEKYGPTYYSFNRGQAHYISLDNVFYKGGLLTEYTYQITPQQLDWVKKDLSYVPKDKVLIVMLHIPTKKRNGDVLGNGGDLRALLSGYKEVQIISGHTHYNSVVVDDSGITEHIAGAACGGWWHGPVCIDGTELGYKIFEIDGTNVKWKYRAYQHPDKQFSVIKPAPRPASLPSSEELLVNVWDWDTAWDVTWSEDSGATFKPMMRYVNNAYDPVAYRYYGIKGDSIPAGQKFIGAALTDHLFTCTPSPGIKNVIIRVVNHFKEEYTESVKL